MRQRGTLWSSSSTPWESKSCRAWQADPERLQPHTDQSCQARSLLTVEKLASGIVHVCFGRIQHVVPLTN
jgi:hypothetical protein